MVRASWGIAVTVLGGLLVIVATQVPPTLSGSTQNRQAPASPTAGKFVVHEWGTFTTFAGSNGVQLDFRPLLDSDLPSFVLNRERQAGARSMLAKSSLFAPVRMETPVTYFYVDEPRTVDVKVQFPNGLLTEFYPPVRSMLPPYTREQAYQRGNSELNWGQVQLIPESTLEPKLGDAELSKLLAQRFMQAAPPQQEEHFHYGAARATDSALVAVNLPPAQSPSGDLFTMTTPAPGGLHVEKFLFYRGVGKFPLPLKAEVQPDGRVQVENTGEAPIQSLYLIDVAPGEKGMTITRASMPMLGANSTAILPPLDETISLADLRHEVQQSLVNEGLFEKEAVAMVRTWSDSWFQERGLRLFYMVPSAVTERVLPLHITPPPDESVRVLVGRMELLPPGEEMALTKDVRQHRLLREERATNGDGSPMPPPEFVKKLGRFAEPALVRVRELTKDEADSREATRLIGELRQNL